MEEKRTNFPAIASLVSTLSAAKSDNTTSKTSKRKSENDSNLSESTESHSDSSLGSEEENGDITMHMPTSSPPVLDELKDLNDNTRPLERRLPLIWQKFRHMPIMQIDNRHRNFLFVWHIFMILGSATLLGFGHIVRWEMDWVLLTRIRDRPNILSYQSLVQLTETPEVDQFYGDLFREYGRAFVTLGSLFLVTTVLYISFLAHRFAFTWPILVNVSIIVLLFELSNILVRLSPHAKLSTNQMRHVKTKLTGYKVNSKDPFSVAYDYISILSHCCGVESKFDFQDQPLTYEEIVNGSIVSHTLQVPLTCCRENIFIEGKVEVVNCAKTLTHTYEMGCFKFFFEFLEKYRAVYVLLLSIWLMDVFIHIHIYRHMVITLEIGAEIDLLDDLETQRKIAWLKNRRMIMDRWNEKAAEEYGLPRN